MNDTKIETKPMFFKISSAEFKKLKAVRAKLKSGDSLAILPTPIDYTEKGGSSTLKNISLGCRGGYMALKFAGKLDMFRVMKGWTIRTMAEKIWGSTTPANMDRMEYLLAGKHEPKAGDIVRIERRLDIRFEADDFESEEMPEKELK